MSGPVRHDIAARYNRWARIIDRHVRCGYLMPEEREFADDISEKLVTMSKRIRGIKIDERPSIAKLEADNKCMLYALDQCISWFLQYAHNHREKGSVEKAMTNQKRAEFCATAVSRVI